MRVLGLFIIIALMSCTSIKVSSSDSENLKFSEDKETTKEYQIGDNGHLVTYLFNLKRINIDSLKSKKLIIQKDAKQIQVSLSKSITRHFTYKKVNKELKCKTKTKLGLLPPILWTLHHESNSICIDANDNMVIYHHHGGTVLLVAFPFGGTSTGQIKESLNHLKTETKKVRLITGLSF